MKFQQTLCTIALVVGTSHALAVETVAPKTAGKTDASASTRGAFFKLNEHEGCNEVQTLVPKVQESRFRWGSTSSGGKETVADFNNKSSLNQNILDEVSFAKSGKITLKLDGKNVVPDSLAPTDAFSHDYSGLLDEEKGTIVGKSIVFHEVPGKNGFKNNDGGYDKRKIMLAAFYFNNAADGGTNTVSCRYISGDINFAEMEKGKCFWIDQKSKPSNGKPYCW